MSHCEKPISHNIVEGRCTIHVVRRYTRVRGRPARSAAAGALLGKAVQLPSVMADWGHSMRGRPSSIAAVIRFGVMAYSVGARWSARRRWLGPAPARLFNENHFHQTTCICSGGIGTSDLGNTRRAGTPLDVDSLAHRQPGADTVDGDPANIGGLYQVGDADRPDRRPTHIDTLYLPRATWICTELPLRSAILAHRSGGCSGLVRERCQWCSMKVGDDKAQASSGRRNEPVAVSHRR